MANNLASNPVIVDSAGIVFSQPVRVKGILILASADTWVVVFDSVKLLENTPRDSGVINFNYTSDIANHRSEYIPMNGAVLNGIWAVTLTDISRVLIYLE